VIFFFLLTFILFFELNLGWFLCYQQANELFSASMVKYYAICSEDDAYPRWHSGPPPTVQIVVERRQGKKLVTLVSMLHKFGIDVQAFAHEAQFKFAASTTVQGEGHLQVTN
jgi:hypothetical protein